MQTIRRVCAGLMLAFLTVHSSFADDFRWEETIYINSSVASVRTEPLDNAPIAAKLPIGTAATYIGSPSVVAAGPNKECGGADPRRDHKWSCICVISLRVDHGVQWCGWVARDLLAAKQLGLADIVAEYDKTPSDQITERRRWAERAVALDPLNAQARERLIDVLEKLNDTKALEAAKRSFDSYSTSQPRATGAKLIFSFYYGRYLEPIAELKEGQLAFRDFDQSANYEFRSRGRFYNLYSDGRKLGTVVTEAQFDCRIQQCPQQTIARSVLTDATGGVVSGLAVVRGLATNFALSNADHSTRKVSKNEEAALQKIATSLVNKSSKLSPKAKKTFLASIQQSDSSPILAIGSLGRDGRVMLIGNWTIGDMNDAHYSDGIYESILIIAEQQKDGTFRLASGSGSLADMGCGYSNHLDVDGDGIDEIFLSCNQLEGQYSYALAKRVEGKWQITYGPSRN
jgi:hypothetical protein